MTLEVMQREIQFSQTAATREAANEEVGKASRLSAEFFDWATAQLGEEQFFLKLALEELFVNVSWHDHLDVHGVERSSLFDPNKELNEDQQRYVMEKILAAHGRCSTVCLEIDSEVLVLTIKLARPFPDFFEKWERAQQAPTEEELEVPTGRGLMLSGHYFDVASYDETEQQLMFRKSRSQNS